MRTGSLDELDQPMDTKLWIATEQEKHVIGHDLNANTILSPLGNNFEDERLKSRGNLTHQDLAAVLGTKHHMIVALIDNICVALNCYPHAKSLAYFASYCN